MHVERRAVQHSPILDLKSHDEACIFVLLNAATSA